MTRTTNQSKKVVRTRNGECANHFNAIDEADVCRPSNQIVDVPKLVKNYCSGMQKLTLSLMISPLKPYSIFSTILQYTIPLFPCLRQSNKLSSCFCILAE